MATANDSKKSLKVIGAGFGRTGTMSLKLALEKLGFDPCYHMVEVIENNHANVWYEFATDQSNDWERAFAGYKAAVDFPVCTYYKELMEAYPDAKVILTTRDPESWYRSCMQTIFVMLGKGNPNYTFPMMVARTLLMGEFKRMTDASITMRQFKGKMDHDSVIQAFKDHEEEVKRTVPPERLLVYTAGEGWEPLCEFLGVPVPDEPYPRVNDSAEFQSRLRAMHYLGVGIIGAGVSLLGLGAYGLYRYLKK